MSWAEEMAEMEGASTREFFGENGRASDKVTIDASDKDLAKGSALAWQAIARANQPPRLFQYGNEPMPVRLIERDDGYRMIQVLNENRFRHELARVANWVEPFRKSYRPSKPPIDLVRDMLAAPELPLPILKQVVRAPFLNRNANLVTVPGYDPESGVWLDIEHLKLPRIPALPSIDELLAALGLLEEMICDFRFAQPSDRAHAYALLFLPIVRQLIDEVTPMHDIEGPIAGSGKGLLAEVLTFPALGHRPPMSGEPVSDAEFNKTLVSVLMAGASHVFIDNVKRPVASAAWARAITSQIFSERVLGINRQLEVPMRLAWVVMANNPSFSDEMARRTIRIRLDPGLEHPEERADFRHPDLTAWVAEHRSEILYAMLVVVQHWLSEGRRPSKRQPLGSFVRWTNIIGGILESAGIEGFLDGRLEAVAIADSETAAWRELFGEWYVQHAARAVSAKDLFPIAKEIAGIFLGRGKDEHAQVVTFGIGLGRRRDQIFTINLDDDKTQVSVKLESAGTFRRAIRWKLTVLA